MENKSKFETTSFSLHIMAMAFIIQMSMFVEKKSKRLVRSKEKRYV